jgi:hypothetical protein
LMQVRKHDEIPCRSAFPGGTVLRMIMSWMDAT